MATARSVLSALTLVAGIVPVGQAADGTAGGAPSADVARAVNAFAVDLYARLRTQQAGNLFCSPQSIATALAMTSLGARGETAAEMARTLHLSVPQADIPAAYAAFLAVLRAKDQPWELSVANRLWGQRGADFLAPFLASMRTGFGAELGRVDFAAQPDAARQEINQWVGRETRDKIRDLLAPGTVTTLTRLVLANAIYFRADWAEQFDRSATSDQPFAVPGGAPRTVPLMFRKVKAGYSALPDVRAKVLELIYRGDALSMVLLLPDAVDGLGALEAQLTLERLESWIAAAGREDVLVYLPRFTVESRFGLADTLAAMGMPSAFAQGRADFSGMNGARDLSISAVAHAARVEVDERGTEAAAATGVVVGLAAALPEKPPTFRADHPFLFAIRDRRSGAILFLGRLVDPS
jgi:serpin B